MSEKLEVGSIVEGKVVRIKPFGAIVSLGSAQGLVRTTLPSTILPTSNFSDIPVYTPVPFVMV